MKIVIHERAGKRIRLRFPTGLVVNRVSAAVISRKLRKKNRDISGKQLYILFRAIKQYKAEHPEWKLVEAASHDGEIIEIIL